MDYEQKYKEALEKASECLKDGTITNTAIAYIETIFPELKESEDERIRKDIIEMLRNWASAHYITKEQFSERMAWLEKQGEKKSIWHNEDEEPLKGSLILLIMQSGNPIVAKIIEPNHTFNHGERWAYIDDLLGKQSEPQILGVGVENASGVLKECIDKIVPKSAMEEIKEEKVDNANKVESKFHKGDWITNGDYTWKIIDVKPLDYILQSQDGNIVDDTISYADKQFHSFTIQDAKDGDFLYVSTEEKGCWAIFKNIKDNNLRFYGFSIGTFHLDGCVAISDIEKINPLPIAPHRERFIEKMHKAGYEWDAKKKELKKIEQKQEDTSELSDFESALFTAFSDAWQQYLLGEDVDIAQWAKEHSSELLKIAKQNNESSWSEEDERIYCGVMSDIEQLKRMCKYDLTKGFYDEEMDWLKSLKERLKGE